MIAKDKKIGNRKNYQSLFFLIFLAILFFGSAFFLVYSNVKIAQRRAEMKIKIESLQKEIKELEEEKAKLESGVIQAGSEVSIEEKIREQGYKKPGEEAVVVMPPEQNQQSGEEKPKNFFQKILDPVRNFFGGL